MKSSLENVARYEFKNAMKSSLESVARYGFKMQ
jgi:hypothetical protein